MTGDHPQTHAPPHDPYRDWLRRRLSYEMGMQEAEHFIQSAVQRRGWKAMRPLGPRDVVAVLQDVYSHTLQTAGEERADRWLKQSSDDLADFAQRVPVPAEALEEAATRNKSSQAASRSSSDNSGSMARSRSSQYGQQGAPLPASWGRRAHDLPLLLARVHSEIASRSLQSIQHDPVLKRLERAAQWDVQATQAEVRRWETEDMLIQLRAEHSRVEIADQVATARAQAELLKLNVAELEQLQIFEPVTDTMRQADTTDQASQLTDLENATKLAHSRLMLTQTQAFLEAFAPLIAEAEADNQLTMLQVDLQHAHFSLAVPLHPSVLRARHGLNFALWQTGQDEQHASVRQARHDLHQAEEEAEAQLEETLENARSHQTALLELAQQVEELEQQALKLSQQGAALLELSRVRLEWRQARAAARIQSHRMEEAVKLLEALVSEG